MPISRFIGAIVSLAVLASPVLAAETTTAAWSDGHTSTVSDEELMQYATASPGPAYPEEAQKAKRGGSGLYELRINPRGAITDVVVLKSSGSAVLDNAAKRALLKWRFKPAIFTRVRLPVSWSVKRIR